MIAVSALRVMRGGRTVLDLADWRVEPGARSLVTGKSGAGKSTLLHVIAGLVRPDAGRVIIGSTDIAALGGSARDAFRGGRIGVVFQTQRLLQTLTVRENLELALRLAKRPVDRVRMAETLERLGIGDKAASRPRTLSVGEAQRAAIARAVVARPSLLLADEPTSALDDENAEAAIELLSDEARACDATLVIASHDLRIAPRFDARLDLVRAT